jgi:hypothetical protein
MTNETLEEAAERLYQYQSQNPPYTIITPKAKVKGFIEGAKWQQERMYSQEEVLDLLAKFRRENRGKDFIPFKDILEWFKKFKKDKL